MPILNELKESFMALAQKNALGHAYVFFGPSEDKLPFARSLVNFLENKKWAEPNKILLDTIIIEASDFGGIKQLLAQKPIASLRRAVIINNAQFLTVADQNSLLKVVEEPPASALIILLAPAPESLIPTLASRCEKIYFGAGKEAVKIDAAAAEMTKIFLRADNKKRSEIIKRVIDVANSANLLDNFIKALFFELGRDPLKNHIQLKELSKRWSLIKQFNVNKRLQLEAALLNHG